jgi:hypothetical protein
MCIYDEKKQYRATKKQKINPGQKHPKSSLFMIKF